MPRFNIRQDEEGHFYIIGNNQGEFYLTDNEIQDYNEMLYQQSYWQNRLKVEKENYDKNNGLIFKCILCGESFGDNKSLMDHNQKCHKRKPIIKIKTEKEGKDTC